MKRFFLLLAGLVGLASNSSAAVIDAAQTAAFTGAIQGGFTEYMTVLISVASIVIPIGIVVGLLWKFIPSVKGRNV